MKRSEAIKIIKKSLGGFTPDDEQCANWILNGLIRAGMLPPNVSPEQGNVPVNEWEPETEAVAIPTNNCR